MVEQKTLTWVLAVIYMQKQSTAVLTKVIPKAQDALSKMA